MDHTEILGHYAQPEPPADNRQRSFKPTGSAASSLTAVSAGRSAAPAVSCLQTSGYGAAAGRFFCEMRHI